MSNGQPLPLLNEDDRRALRAANLPIQVRTVTHLHVMLTAKQRGDANAA